MSVIWRGNMGTGEKGKETGLDVHFICCYVLYLCCIVHVSWG